MVTWTEPFPISGRYAIAGIGVAGIMIAGLTWTEITP